MEVNQSAGFKILGADDAVYGPVELPTLVEWVRDERVTGDTWIYTVEQDSWKKAVRIQELQIFFKPKRRDEDPNVGLAARLGHFSEGIKPATFRRVKILADLTDDQLEKFVEYMEIKRVRQWFEVVKQGEPGDAMYLVLEGELRVRMMIGGKETILTTLHAGDMFGDVSLFDKGPRSADVVSNRDSILLRISDESFAELMSDVPELLAPVLFGICKTLVARIRADNKRFRDSVNFARSTTEGE